MTSGPGAVSVITRSLLSTVANALAGTVAGRPDRVCLQPGEIVWDECECGELIAAITAQYITDNFPVASTARPTVQVSYCRAAWLVADVNFQIVRCAPTPAEGATTVSCDKLQASAEVVLSDAWVVLNTLACELQSMKDLDTIVDYTMQNQTFIGPEGGCVGSQVGVSIGLDRSF